MNFLNYKIIGASKKFKNQLRPLVRPGFVNFYQNIWNLSHETVPLNMFTGNKIYFLEFPYPPKTSLVAFGFNLIPRFIPRFYPSVILTLCPPQSPASRTTATHRSQPPLSTSTRYVRQPKGSNFYKLLQVIISFYCIGSSYVALASMLIHGTGTKY
jgi:hypothetical protein